MEKFRSVLREINNKLDLPQPTKSRIILEIAADLIDAFDIFKKQGFDDKEALLKAKNTFKLDKKNLDDLILIHQTPFRKWFDKLSERGQNMLERIIFSIIMIIVIVSGFYTALESNFVLEAGSFIWVIFAIFLLASTLFIIKVYQIYIKKDHTLQKIKRGVSSLLGLSGTALLICIGSYFWELYAFGQYAHILETKMIYLLHTKDPVFPQMFRDMIDWMISSSAFIMISIVFSVLIAFMWFIIMNKISKIEAAEAEMLLAE
jgi:hypothetical protein